jgi:DNA-binding NtrC family response regulator
MSNRILIVGADPAISTVVADLLEITGFEPTATSGAAEAIRRIGDGRFDVAVVDFELPDGDATGVVMKARACRPAVPTLALTAHGSVTAAVEALRAGAVDVVSKPFHTAALVDALRRVGVRKGRTPTNSQRTPGIAIIGDHPAMRLVLDRVEQIADTEASVLIRGETGTGKEVVARLIHGASARRTRPFVAVNLAAIPESLAEAELFGHVEGAFTGADRARAGRLLAANGGTLFFDEIADMPRSVQAKLLRVLQDRALTPVGGGDAIPVDVRVVAASQRDLEGMIADGRFREDLYYRLDVLPIEIPPLRARREDIPALAEHFRAEINAREGRSVPGFALDVMQRLTHYDWPGNVRELANVVERAVVVAATRMVVMGDLPCHLRAHAPERGRAALDLPEHGVDLPILLDEIEDHLIDEALSRSRGNRNRAAELLGLNRTTLVEKLRRRNVA